MFSAFDGDEKVTADPAATERPAKRSKFDKTAKAEPPAAAAPAPVEAKPTVVRPFITNARTEAGDDGKNVVMLTAYPPGVTQGKPVKWEYHFLRTDDWLD